MAHAATRWTYGNPTALLPPTLLTHAISPEATHALARSAQTASATKEAVISIPTAWETKNSTALTEPPKQLANSQS